METKSDGSPWETAADLKTEKDKRMENGSKKEMKK